MDFENKVVLITGATGGIGTAAAKEFAQRGAKLSL
ncbi:MAG: SDR family NAD(P)-dependent oxidoreductase, partial [Bacilli bacterium]|nr:SDR family NAD(P)-dependent oxidoreductase [Bacilli bacterium]